MLDWKDWIYGLVGAVINAVANSATIVIIAPESFNFQEGLPKLLNASIVFGILGAALYLKQKPLPCLTPADEAAIVAAKVVATKAVETAKTEVEVCRDETKK